MENSEITLASLMLQIPTEEAAYTWLESIRWPHGPVCPHCGVIDHAYYLKPKNGGRKTRTGKVSERKVWKCGDCRKQFTVTVGTCMERSKIPMRNWALAFHLLSAAKNGMSSHELGRALEISHESAWFMSHRIRYALTPNAPRDPFTGTVEADETYVGGKRKRDEPDNKTPVMSLVERNGEIRSHVVNSVNKDNVKDILLKQMQPEAELFTDQSTVYTEVGQMFATHETVNHGEEEWVRGRVHVNTLEGYFSQFKRSLDGTHHHVSPEHLHRYVSEFDFRYNTRKDTDGERTVKAIKGTAGKRLMYKETTGRQ